MGRPKLLDLFCGAGGAGMGYHLAGFDVTGVDNKPMPRYPFTFKQDDALEYLAVYGREFDVIHASPPCQDHSTLTKSNRIRPGWTDNHIDLIGQTRALLDTIGLPYVIENVQSATIRRDITLCGEMFGLDVIRHRWFELSGWTMFQPHHPKHRGRVAGWRHGVCVQGPYFQVYGDGGGKGTVAEWQQAMGIDWTDDRKELAEAIPPAYTRFIGEQLLAHLGAVVS